MSNKIEAEAVGKCYMRLIRLYILTFDGHTSVVINIGLIFKCLLNRLIRPIGIVTIGWDRIDIQPRDGYNSEQIGKKGKHREGCRENENFHGIIH